MTTEANKAIRQIRHLNNEMINITRWDECVMSSFNGIIYAFSWYLDIVNPDWEGLIMGDYEAIMPLPIKRKFGIKYVVQPMFTQQLGIFSSQKITPDIIEHFIRHIPYAYLNLCFNSLNLLPQEIQAQKLRITYELDLIQSHAILSSRYSTNTKRNIQKSKKEGVKIVKGLSPQEFIQFTKGALGTEEVGLQNKHYNQLRQITIFALRNRIGEIYAAYDSKNNLSAVALFITTHHRSIMLVNASTDAGKEIGAMFAIIDEFIREHSNRNQILDFEGSNIEGIARFYKSFSAIPSNYTHLILNKLPYFIKLLIKLK